MKQHDYFILVVIALGCLVTNVSGTNTWDSPGYSTPNGIAMTHRANTNPIASEWFVVIRGMDNHIYFNIYNVTGSWAGWTPLGGTTNDEPTVAYTGNDYGHVVIRGTDNGLYYKKLNMSSSTWDTSWTSLGGHTLSAPTLISGSSSQWPGDPDLNPSLWLAIRGTDNHLYLKGWDPDTGWEAGWQKWGGTTYDRPALAFKYSMAPGGSILTLGVRGSDNKVYTRSGSVGFGGAGMGPWTSPGGSTLSPPAICYTDGVFHIVVRGTDNHVYHKAGSASYEALGGTTYDMPAVENWFLGGYLTLGIRGADSKVYINAVEKATGEWIGWNNTILGGSTLSHPTFSDNALAVRGTDSRVYVMAVCDGC